MDITIDARQDDEDPVKRLIWRVAKLQTSPSRPADYYAEIKSLVEEFGPGTMVRALMDLITFSMHHGIKWDGDRLILAELGGCSID